MRRSFAPIAGAAFVLEAALFSTLTALLPHYESRFGMSTFASGVLTGCYAAGMIVGTLMAGLWLGRRIGVRSTALIGCVLLAVSSLAFGAAGNVVELDLARAAQGLGAGLLWCSLLNWLILVVPPASRGFTLGAALGAAVFGTAAGPVLGAATQVVGTFAVFAGVAVAVLLFAVFLARTDAPPEDTADTAALAQPCLSPDSELRWIAAVGFLPPFIVGGVITMVPLQLAGLGASEIAIDIVLAVGAVLSALSCLLAGRMVDRRGHLPPVFAGILICFLALVGMAAADSSAALVAAYVGFQGIGLGFFWIPLISLFSGRGEAAGMSAAAAALVINMTFNAAFTVGPPLIAAGEHLLGQSAAYLALAGVAVLGLLTISRRRGFTALAATHGADAAPPGP